MTLKIAMLGTGRIAENKLLPALEKTDQAVLWSVLSRDKARAGEIATRFSAQSANPAHDNLAELLADPELDAVMIATPDKLHSEQAIAAARAGKHVLTEKPMTTSLDEADAMLDACRQANVKLGVAFHNRWHAGQRKLHEEVGQGRLGELRHMRVQWSFQAPDAANWRAHSEVGQWWGLAGVGTHLLDQVLWFLEPTCGDLVDLKSIVTKDVWKGPNDETALITMKFASGATADLCSSVLFQAPTRFELYGSKGYAMGEDVVFTTGVGTMQLNGKPYHFTPNDPYQLEIEDFAAAVRDGRAPEVDGEMGRRNTAILVRATT